MLLDTMREPEGCGAAREYERRPRTTRDIARASSRRRRGAELAALAAYQSSVAAVARAMGVAPAAMEARRGRLYRTPPPEVATARRSAVYLAVVVFNRSMRSIARAARLTPEGVRKAVAAIEDRRDDPGFEQVISQLEAELAC